MSESISSRAEDEAPGSPAAKAVVGHILGAITDVQRRALNLIAEGQSISEIAATVGVNRGTIHRWIRADPYFRAAYNAWQLEQRDACQAALLKCARDAVKRIERMVNIDEHVALKVVKELGLFRTSQALHTDPDRVAREIETEKIEDEALLEQRRTGGLLPVRRSSKAQAERTAVAAPAAPVSQPTADLPQPAPSPTASAPPSALSNPDDAAQAQARQRVARQRELDRVATTIG